MFEKTSYDILTLLMILIINKIICYKIYHSKIIFFININITIIIIIKK